MVRLPLQTATVGLSTLSITRLNGSVRPVSRSAARCSISGSNLEKRSATGVRQADQRIDELADRLDLRLHVHGDDDVELVLDVGDEIEHGEAVPLEVLRETRSLGDGDALLVERLDEIEGLVENLLAVGHDGSLVAAPRFRNAMGRECGGERAVESASVPG